MFTSRVHTILIRIKYFDNYEFSSSEFYSPACLEAASLVKNLIVPSSFIINLEA